MYLTEVESVGVTARKKVELLKNNFLGYFIAAMLAGIYVGFGVVLVFGIGSCIIDNPLIKVIMGLSFGVTLSLVVMAGGELFTGNNLVMAMGVFNKNIGYREAGYALFISLIGNWAGSVLISLGFYYSGLMSEKFIKFLGIIISERVLLNAHELFIRGILCNILVCLAVWCCYRCKSDSGKLLMIFWCLFALVTAGFENSVACMTLLSVAFLGPFDNIFGFIWYVLHIGILTAGNMVGGIFFVALPYYLISRKDKNK